MPIDLVEQNPAAVEYSPTDGAPAKVILTPTGVVEQTPASVLQPPPSTNGLPRLLPTDLVKQKPAAVEYAQRTKSHPR